MPAGLQGLTPERFREANERHGIKRGPLVEGLEGLASRPVASSKANEMHGVKTRMQFLEGLQGMKKKHCLQGLEACKFPQAWPGGRLGRPSFPRPGRPWEDLFPQAWKAFLPQTLKAWKSPQTLATLLGAEMAPVHVLNHVFAMQKCYLVIHKTASGLGLFLHICCMFLVVISPPMWLHLHGGSLFCCTCWLSVRL